ncbi:MAG TPA: GrpB family protein [Herpetosiphonaceae bacterium]
MSQPPANSNYSTAVVPHDPAWAAEFEARAAEIAAVLGEDLVAIHHAGSTSIPGIRAKPTIDFVVVARSLQALDAAADAMSAHGYDVRGEMGIPGRRFFTRNNGTTRTHNVHSFAIGDPEIERMLNLRDYLRAHPEDAQAYSRLKEELARQFPDDVTSYTDGKSAFIEEIIRRAKLWREQASE